MKHLFLFLLGFCSLGVSAQWTSQNSGTLNSLNTVDIADANTVYAAGVNTLIKSINGGANWNNIPILNTSNQPINSLVINDLHFFDSQTGIAVGAQASVIRVILRTVDGGAHWSVVLTANDQNGWLGGYFKVHFIDNNTGWAVGTSGAISKTVNGGQTWTTLFLPNATHLYDVQFLNSQTGMVCGKYEIPGIGNQLVLAQSLSGGIGWNPWPFAVGGYYQELFFLTDLVGYIASDQGLLYRINDGTNFTNSNNVSMPDLAPVRRMHFSDVNSGYALTDYSIRKTDNAGVFWSQAALGLNSGQELMDFDFSADGNTGFAVGKAGKIFKTSNGGAPYSPMAFFTPIPNQGNMLCKGQTYLFENAAPEASYTSQWYLNGQLISTAHDLEYVVPEGGATYQFRLVISGPNGSSEFIQTFESYPEVNFSFGEITWLTQPPICAGGNLSFQINNPTVAGTYVAFVNDVPFSALFANNTDPLVFSTPSLSAGDVIRVEGSYGDACGLITLHDTLEAQIYAYPNTGLAVETSTPAVCLYGSATITIHQSQPGVFYLFTGGFTEANPIEGNGGDLIFQTPPLFQTSDYQIIANNWNCTVPLSQTVQIAVDAYFSQLDTLNMYGMVQTPITISNPSSGLASVQWDFSGHVSPSQSTLFQPTVVFAESGLSPFTYEFQSDGACVGSLSGNFEIYAQGEALPGIECPSNELIGLNWEKWYEKPLVFQSETDNHGNLVSTGAIFEKVGWYETMNLFVQKNKASGEMIWQKNVQPQGPGQGAFYRSSYGTGLALDAGNNIYLCGTWAADQARLFGQDFAISFPENKSYPQGFVMKLDSSGNVLWKISIQTLSSFSICAASSLAYSTTENLIYVVVHGSSWQAILPDGNTTGDFSQTTGAWVVAFNQQGQFVKSLPLGDIELGSLLGGFHPEFSTGGTNGPTSTYLGPRVHAGPNGAMYVEGQVLNDNTIQFGAQQITANDFGPNYQQRNHFVAVYDPFATNWSQAFFTYRVEAFTGDNGRYPIPFTVDSQGNSWLGVGLIQPENSTPGVLATHFAIGNEAVETKSNRGYLAKFSPQGQLDWVTRASNMYFHGLEENGEGGVFALSGFMKTAGFQTDNGFLGTPGFGNKDVLLSEFASDGTLKGLKVLGSNFWDQPISMTRSKVTGDVYSLFMPNLNLFFNGLIPQPLRLNVHKETGECPMVPIWETPDRQLFIQATPNPVAVGNAFQLVYELPDSDELQVQILDMLGRNVWHTDLGAQSAGNHVLPMEQSLPELTSGVYQVVLQGKKYAGAVRLMVSENR